MPLAILRVSTAVAMGAILGLASPVQAEIAYRAIPQVHVAQASPTVAPPSQQTTLPSSAQKPGGETGPIAVKLKPNPTLTGWTKVCNTDTIGNSEVCYTTLDFMSDEGKPALAVALYETRSGPQAGTKLLRFMTPTSLLLQQGLRFIVDNGQWTPGRYRICLPNGCVAEAPVKDDVVSALTKGTSITVSVLNAEGREVAFTMPLAGFAKSYDGPPIGPEALRQQQETFLKDAERRGREFISQSQQRAGERAGEAPAKP